MWLQRWWNTANISEHNKGNIFNTANRRLVKSSLDLSRTYAVINRMGRWEKKKRKSQLGELTALSHTHMLSGS